MGAEPNTQDVDDVTWHSLNIVDRSAVNQLLSELRPDVIFHLAAQSHVPTSWMFPDATWAVNLEGTRHLLDAARSWCPDGLFINIASSDIYGATFIDCPIVTEASPLLPMNPYAASKAAADLAAYQASYGAELKIIRVRPFNHSGPGQSDSFVLPGFAAQIACIEAGLLPPVIKVGNLQAERDFLHVDDVARAYVLLMEAAERIESGSVFNVASGQSLRIEDLLLGLLSRSKLVINVEADVSLSRPSDILRVCGSADLLAEVTGWRPCRDVHYLLDDVLAHWRKAVSEDGIEIVKRYSNNPSG
jgi:GDP-4-dehydro-6-deoxy-D-mannose reductase